MFYLTILMIERVGFVIILAFLLVNVLPAPDGRTRWIDKVQLTIIFAIFAILANSTGIEIDPANQLHDKVFLTAISKELLNRQRPDLTVSVAGIIGGPWVGGRSA